MEDIFMIAAYDPYGSQFWARLVAIFMLFGLFRLAFWLGARSMKKKKEEKE